jgi:hypothetical protein
VGKTDRQSLTTSETLSKADLKDISYRDALSDIDLSDPSQDEAYLYYIAPAIRTGVICDDLTREKLERCQ